MTERQRIEGLAEQIEFARSYRQQWPDWLRSTAHFSGSNHPDDVKSDNNEQEIPENSDQDAAAV
jgi:hypothetical protein